MPAAHDTLDSASVLAECGSDDPADFIRAGIVAGRADQFEKGLILLAEAHRRISRDKQGAFPPLALSYYGLCLAMHTGRAKEAAEFCQAALEREFFNIELYANMGRVWAAARSRRKAVDAIDRGLAVEPRNQMLLKLRETLGVRKQPVLPFLHRNNPLNVTLGRVRHTIKSGKKGSSG